MKLKERKNEKEAQDLQVNASLETKHSQSKSNLLKREELPRELRYFYRSSCIPQQGGNCDLT